MFLFKRKKKVNVTLTPKLSYLPYTVEMIKSYKKNKLYALKPLVKKAHPFGFILTGELRRVYRLRMQTPMDLSLFINILSNYEQAKVLVYIRARLSDEVLGEIEKIRMKDKKPRVLRKIFTVCDQLNSEQCVFTETLTPSSQFSMENYFSPSADREKWKLLHETFGYAHIDPMTRDAELILLAPKSFFSYKAELLQARPMFF
ncbi:hypothetical protein [Saccharolobus sp.]|uniref:hypothetical protein n=1 Tax=Saccharolobus sp. TaxID=2100761 RepID=UPI003171AE42